MGIFAKLPGGSKSEMIVDAMVGICVHDPDILLSPPSNTRKTAESSLKKALGKATLSPTAKTAYFIAQGSLDFKASEEQASKDLAEQLQLFLVSSGIEPNQYDMKFFSEDLRSDIKVLWAAAVRK